MSIYLDYGAATPLDPQVLEAMMPYLTERFYNPSAAYDVARLVRADIENARERVAHCIGAQAASIIFTAGATEANNLALTALQKDDVLLTDTAEHPSILQPCSQYRHSYIGVTSTGALKLDDLTDQLTPQVGMVSVELANGENGVVHPMTSISKLVKQERMRRLWNKEPRPIYLHSDASQACATRSINCASLGVDMLTLSAGKIYGPKQIGLLWVKEGIRLHPLVHGGGQEGGLRSGTENVAGIIGFARALEIACEQRKATAAHLEKFRSAFISRLKNAIPWVIIHGEASSSHRLSSLISLSFPGLQARRLLLALELRGVYVATGSACAASKMQVSHVLEAMGLEDSQARASLRITMGRQSTLEELLAAADILQEIVVQECMRIGLDPRSGTKSE